MVSLSRETLIAAQSALDAQLQEILKRAGSAPASMWKAHAELTKAVNSKGGK